MFSNKHPLALLSLLACLLLSACGGGGGGAGSAGDVVKRYITAVIQGDKAGALECIDPAKRSMAGPMLDMGIGIASGFAKMEGGLDSVSVVTVESQGDRARVAYLSKTKKGVERRESANAEKINGKWYVAP
jgi:hypothetical protein